MELDGFLLGALQNNKDRLFILRLERDLEQFVQEKSRMQMEIPPLNAYFRRMVHRIAALFHLEHIAQPDRNLSMVLRKTSETKMPLLRLCECVQHEELAELEEEILTRGTDQATTVKILRNRPQREEPESKDGKVVASAWKTPLVLDGGDNSVTPHGNQPPANQPPAPPQPMKIMRRKEAPPVNADKRNTNSITKTKTDPHPPEGIAAITLEEKEAAYARARARIFENEEHEVDFTKTIRSDGYEQSLLEEDAQNPIRSEFETDPNAWYGDPTAFYPSPVPYGYPIPHGEAYEFYPSPQSPYFFPGYGYDMGGGTAATTTASVPVSSSTQGSNGSSKVNHSRPYFDTYIPALALGHPQKEKLLQAQPFAPSVAGPSSQVAASKTDFPPLSSSVKQTGDTNTKEVTQKLQGVQIRAPPPSLATHDHPTQRTFHVPPAELSHILEVCNVSNVKKVQALFQGKAKVKQIPGGSTIAIFASASQARAALESQLRDKSNSEGWKIRIWKPQMSTI